MEWGGCGVSSRLERESGEAEGSFDYTDSFFLREG